MIKVLYNKVGDFMKKTFQTSLLFIFIIALFIGAFFTINRKYDRFYRVKGIDNDKRAIIEQYLSESEQNFLVQNQIPLTAFFDYVEYDQFDLRNYRIYNLLKDTGRYNDNNTLLTIGNDLQKKIAKNFSSNNYAIAQTLIEDDLEYGYINNDDFNSEDINLYALLRPLYGNDDASYVDDLNNYKEALTKRGLNESDIVSFMTDVVSVYKKNSLKQLMTQAENTSMTLIRKPNALSMYLNASRYIGSYVPDDLVLIQDIKRYRYAMYLRSDAYKKLTEMCKADKTINSRLVIYKAYTKYASLSDEEKGHSEYQLGLTLSFTDRYVDYGSFDETKVSSWLKENAYKYGFVLRYPSEHADKTGHAYDAHVYRFVGVKLAKKLHEQNKVLENYQEESEE